MVATVSATVAAVVSVVLAYMLTRHMARETREADERKKELGEVHQVLHELLRAQPRHVLRRMRPPPGW